MAMPRIRMKMALCAPIQRQEIELEAKLQLLRIVFGITFDLKGELRGF
jgi:hypothetical protein